MSDWLPILAPLLTVFALVSTILTGWLVAGCGAEKSGKRVVPVRVRAMRSWTDTRPRSGPALDADRPPRGPPAPLPPRLARPWE